MSETMSVIHQVFTLELGVDTVTYLKCQLPIVLKVEC